MLQRLVAQWIQQQARETVARELHQHYVGDDSKSEEPPAVDIAIVFPSSAEAGGFVDKLSRTKSTMCCGFKERRGRLGNHQVLVIEAPLPYERLAPMTRDIVHLHRPQWLISAGFCTSLRGLPVGHIVMANPIVDAAGYALHPGFKVDQRSLPEWLHVGTLLSDLVAANPDAQPPQVIAQERQAAVIAEVCRVLRTKMMAVHIIAGEVGREQQRFVKKFGDQGTWAAKLGAAAGALIEQPGSLKELLNDKERTLRLSDRLAGYLASMMEQLAA